MAATTDTIGTNDACTLERLVQAAGELYSLPRVTVQVLELTAQPEVNSWDLKQCIENDPALTSKLLRVVNSSLFGLSREVADLNQALALLGIKPLKLLVLGFSLPDALFQNLAGEVLARYWQHTLIKAVAARELSQTMFQMPGDEAFIAGLLQDLGMLVLIQQLGPPYVEFLERMHVEAAPILPLERAMLGFDHRQLTAELLTHWRLPNSIVEATRSADPSQQLELAAMAGSMPQVLHLADLVAVLLTGGHPAALCELLERGRRYESLAESQLAVLVEGLQEKVSQLAEVLSLELPGGQDYRDVLLRAQSQLAGVAEEAARELLETQTMRDAKRVDRFAATDEGRRLREAAVRWMPDTPASRPRPAAAVARISAEPVGAVASPAATKASAGRQRTVSSNLAGRPVSQPTFDPALLGWLSAAVTACRQVRRPVSLLLVEIDGFDELVFTRGMARAEQVFQRIRDVCREFGTANHRCMPAAEARLGIVLPDCDRHQAVQLGNDLLRLVRHLDDDPPREERPGVTVSIGVAAVNVPPRNFAAQELVSAADRCLFGSQTGGGNCLKSIEV